MKRSDIWSGIFWLLISMWVVIESIGFDLGKWGSPGPGLLPFCSGIILALLSLFIIFRAIYKKTDVPAENWFMEIRWKKWSLTLTGLLAYALLLEFLGFILCTLIFMIFLLAFVERQRWIIILLVTVLTAAASYVVFELCLKAQLPKGFLGI